MMIPLAMLGVGQNAEVTQVIGLPAHVHRLEELGIRTGTRIKMVQSGSPCIVGLAGSRLCFRQTDALAVLVRPDSDPSPEGGQSVDGSRAKAGAGS